MSDQPAAAGTTGLPRGVVVLLGLASAIVILGGMRFASGLVAPIVLALVLTIAVAPLSHWARRKAVPAWATVILSLIAVYAVVLVLVGGIALSTVKLATILPQYADKAQEQIHELSKRLADAGFDKAPTQEALSQPGPRPPARRCPEPARQLPGHAGRPVLPGHPAVLPGG